MDFPPSIGAVALNAFKIVEYLAKYGHKVLVLFPGVFSKTSSFSEFSNISINLDIN